MTSPWPAPEPQRKSQKPEGLILGVAALLGVAMFVGAFFWWQSIDSGADTDAASQSVDAPGPGGPGSGQAEAAPPPPEGDVETLDCPEDVLEEICDAAEFVQQARGRPFKTFPNVELMSDDEFQSALLVDFETEEEELLESGQILKGLGLVKADVDIVEVYRDLLSIGVVGFYDTETEQLVVRGSDLNLYAQSVTVHELAHAFDDQWHDLNADELEDDAGFGYLSVVEGNASRVENWWRSGLDANQQAEMKTQELALIAPEDFGKLVSFPPVLIELITAPYTDGETFVDHVFDKGGEEAVDELFGDSPETSEQILELDRFDADEQALDTPDPEEFEQTIDDGDLGQIVIKSWLGDAAAEGWGGDRYTLGKNSAGATCIAVNLTADSETDLAEMETAAKKWAQGSDGRTVSDADGSVLEITGCF